MIEVRNLSYRYAGASKAALQSVDLSIESGESVLLTGPSGSGKSTLALALAAVLFTQFNGNVTGKVIVDGMDMRSTPVFAAADCVGLVQQNSEAQFCTLNVLDEVAFGLENRCLPAEEIRSRVEWALSAVGALHLMGRDLSTLSGGEKQKIAIAAVMAARPRVLILDEPTSNLDPSATAEVLRVIADLRRSAGLTVIIIEHKWVDMDHGGIRQVHLVDGRVSYDGPLNPGRPLWTFDRRPRRPSSARGEEEKLVEIGDLVVRHGEELALKGVSLTLAAGEFVAVMGDNGSGKTTLLQAMLGLVKPSEGRVEVFGNDTRTARVSELARNVAFIFQNPDHQLFAASVWDEAILAATNFGIFNERVREQTLRLLQRCGLQERVGDHPYKLSYGEKRRLNLASTLNYEPGLILLDEILIGQDWENARFLLDAIAERVDRGATAVLVNHSPVVTQAYAQRLLFLHDGRLLVDAPVPEAFRELVSVGFAQYSPRSEATEISQAQVSV
jgi:energy-coupling factor transporter ATP-binding protein EcfA2